MFVIQVMGKYYCEYICPRSAKSSGSGRGFSFPPFSSLDCGKSSAQMLGVEWKFPAAVLRNKQIACQGMSLSMVLQVISFSKDFQVSWATMRLSQEEVDGGLGEEYLGHLAWVMNARVVRPN